MLRAGVEEGEVTTEQLHLALKATAARQKYCPDRSSTVEQQVSVFQCKCLRFVRSLSHSVYEPASRRSYLSYSIC